MLFEKHVILRDLKKYTLLFLGAIIAAAGVEIFLVPNNIIDGGIVGISIITSILTKIPLGYLTFILNVPFLIIGYKQIGKTFVIASLFSITCFSVAIQMMNSMEELTHDVLLAAVFGGIVLGAGVGLIIRHGGSLDGTEIIAIIINKNTTFSIGQTVMVFNIFIYTSLALILEWDRALYSMLAYYVAHKTMDVIIEGVDEEKAVIIVTKEGKEISEAINARLGRGVTVLKGVGGFSQDDKTILYSVITRLEISKMKSIICEKDKEAFATISDVADVMGGMNKKKSIH